MEVHLGASGGNGIPAPTTPRVAPGQATDGQPAAAPGTVLGERLAGVDRTGRLVATGRGPTSPRPLVEGDRRIEDADDDAHRRNRREAPASAVTREGSLAS